MTVDLQPDDCSVKTNTTIFTDKFIEGRINPISRITVHCTYGNITVEEIGALFTDETKNKSCNYSIDSNGRIGYHVAEENTSLASNSLDNDSRAITIMVATEDEDPFEVTKEAWKSLVNLCIDICARYEIKLTYTGDTNGTLTEHSMFLYYSTCPGPYLHEHMSTLAKEVRLGLAL